MSEELKAILDAAKEKARLLVLIEMKYGKIHLN